MKKIYLAIPYSSIDHELSFDTSNRIASDLSNTGYCVFAPISHTHMMAKKYGLPKTWDFWEKIDREFIAWCDELWVIKLEGWQESTGVKSEIMIALEMGKTVRSIKV